MQPLKPVRAPKPANLRALSRALADKKRAIEQTLATIDAHHHSLSSKHIKGNLRFKVRPKGEEVYRSYSAMPLSHNQRHLTQENIEALYFRGFLKTGNGERMKGGGGHIGIGKVKIKGILKPKEVVIKLLTPYRTEHSSIGEAHEIVHILRKQNIKHVKMEPIYFGKEITFTDAQTKEKFITSAAILMEPFVKKAKGKIISKFMHKTKGHGDMINNLDLSRPIHQDIFRQSVKIALQLAKNKVTFCEAWDEDTMHPRVDAFNAILTKNGGKPKASVYVQDLGTLTLIHGKSIEDAVYASMKRLVLTVRAHKKSNEKTAKDIIDREMMRAGLS